MKHLLLITAMLFCSCEAVGPAVGAIGHGVGIWQRDNLIDKATEIGDTTALNHAMLVGLCNKFEVDTAPVAPAETPSDSSNPVTDYAGLAGLVGLLGLLGKLARNKQVQELAIKTIEGGK